MMSVTQLLHGGSVAGQIMAQGFNTTGNSSISPTGSSSIEQLQQQQQQTLLNAVQQQQQQLLQQQSCGVSSQSQSQSPQTTTQQLMVQNTNSIVCDNRTGSAMLGNSVQNSATPVSSVSPTGATPNVPVSGSVGGGGRYPPNHPLSGSKHLCAICEDRASGKHYGVYRYGLCEGKQKKINI